MADKEGTLDAVLKEAVDLVNTLAQLGVGAVLGVVAYCADKAHMYVGSWISSSTRGVSCLAYLRWCTILLLYYVLGFMR